MKKRSELQYPSIRRRAVTIYAGGLLDLAIVFVPATVVGSWFSAISPGVGQFFTVVSIFAGFGLQVAMAHKGFSPSKWLFGYQIVDRDTAEPVGAVRYYLRGLVASFSAALYTVASIAPALFVKAMGDATNAGTYRDPRTVAHVIEDHHHTVRTNALASGTAMATGAGIIGLIQKYGLIHDKIFKTCAVNFDRKEALVTLFKPRQPVADMTETQPTVQKAA